MVARRAILRSSAGDLWHWNSAVTRHFLIHQFAKTRLSNRLSTLEIRLISERENPANFTRLDNMKIWVPVAVQAPFHSETSHLLVRIQLLDLSVAGSAVHSLHNVILMREMHVIR